MIQSFTSISRTTRSQIRERTYLHVCSRAMYPITSLILCDNQIHADGGKYLGKALKLNDTLLELDLRLNRLSDVGGALLFNGLVSNSSLNSLNVSCNSLGTATAKKCIEYLKADTCALLFLDITCNEFGEHGCKQILDSADSEIKIDARGNGMEEVEGKDNDEGARY